jgi:hypothetical protein
MPLIDALVVGGREAVRKGAPVRIASHAVGCDRTAIAAIATEEIEQALHAWSRQFLERLIAKVDGKQEPGDDQDEAARAITGFASSQRWH